MSALKNRREFKIGVFTIVILLSMYFVVNYLKGKDLLGSRNTYNSYFYDVDGLTPTAPVYMRGLKIGTIESINFVQERDQFLLVMKINSKYVIPADSKVLSFSSDLMGSKAVKIELGSSNEPVVNKGVLQSGYEVGMVESLANQFTPLAEQLSSLVSSLDTTINSINNILSSQTQAQITNSITNLEASLKGLNSLINNINKSSPQITGSLEAIHSLTQNLDKGTLTLNSTLENINQITDSLKEAELAATIESLHTLLEKLTDPNGSIGKLMASDSLHNSTNNLIKALESLIGNINSNPKKYIRISVF